MHIYFSYLFAWKLLYMVFSFCVGFRIYEVHLWVRLLVFLYLFLDANVIIVPERWVFWGKCSSVWKKEKVVLGWLKRQFWWWQMYTKNLHWQDLLFYFCFFSMKIIQFAHNHTAKNVHRLFWLLLSYQKKRTVVPRHLTNHAHKAERGSVPRVEQGRPCWNKPTTVEGCR